MLPLSYIGPQCTYLFTHLPKLPTLLLWHPTSLAYLGYLPSSLCPQLIYMYTRFTPHIYDYFQLHAQHWFIPMQWPFSFLCSEKIQLWNARFACIFSDITNGFFKTPLDVLLIPLFVNVPKKLVLLWKLLSNGDTKPKRKRKDKKRITYVQEILCTNNYYILEKYVTNYY